MGFKDLINKAKQSARNAQEERRKNQAATALAKEEAARAEEERKQDILAGKIPPVNVTISLKAGEKAYLALTAKRTANVEHIIEKTTGTSKKKGVITRGIVGGVLLGPVGMVAGAATAKSKHTGQTVQETVVRNEVVDQGTIYFTNQRVMFIGNNIISLPYSELVAYNFGGSKLMGYRFIPKYSAMLPNEAYIISGPSAHEASFYYTGITSNLLS